MKRKKNKIFKSTRKHIFVTLTSVLVSPSPPSDGSGMVSSPGDAASWVSVRFVVWEWESDGMELGGGVKDLITGTSPLDVVVASVSITCSSELVKSVSGTCLTDCVCTILSTGSSTTSNTAVEGSHDIT